MSDSRLTNIPERVAANWPVDSWKDVNVVLAVSGGADSVALLLAAHELRQSCQGRGELIVAHVNHHLRGEDADRDARWVENLARQLDLRFELRDAQPPGDSTAGEGLEGALRQQRYELLTSLARESGSRWLCTAHHANDQAETIIFRILRGTGLDGLAGIPRTRVIEGGITIHRPLLDLTREEIEQWLSAVGQAWCIDSTNADTKYSRNRIRHHVLPALQKVADIDLVKSLTELAASAADLRQTLDRLASDLIKSHFRVVNDGFEIEVAGVGLDDPGLWVQAIRMAWQRMQWPCQNMNRKKWLALVGALRDVSDGIAVDTFEMPGKVRVSAKPGILVCQRS